MHFLDIQQSLVAILRRGVDNLGFDLWRGARQMVDQPAQDCSLLSLCLMYLRGEISNVSVRFDNRLRLDNICSGDIGTFVRGVSWLITSVTGDSRISETLLREATCRAAGSPVTHLATLKTSTGRGVRSNG